MKAKEVTQIALRAGEILLKNGAETFRIEETVTSICLSYGYKSECVSLPYGIFLLVEKNEHTKFTTMKKVNNTRFDLHKIELVNSFSRELKNNILPLEEANERLNEIDNVPNFSLFFQTIAAAITGFVYTIIFQGKWFDGITAFAICIFIFILVNKTKKNGSLQYIIFFIAGFFIGLLTNLLALFIPILDVHSIIIGSIMILVPGIIMTNGLKDFVYGDFSSGMAKIFEALLIISAVAVGVGVALTISMKGVGI